jgi:hypothetical protein
MEKNQNKLQDINLKNVKLNSGLLADKNKLVREVVIPYQWQALNDELSDAEPSHAIENFKIAAGKSQGEFHGMVFQDSDVAKWLEAVAYQLASNPDPELEKRADEVIDLVGEAQLEDGYLNTYFIVKEPKMKWKNLAECHELYCSGHFIEAAVAYYQATGKDKLLEIMEKNVDLIASKFGPEADKLKGYPGHQEIELALVKLFKLTGKNKYLTLAKYFIDQRGQEPFYFDQEWQARNEKNHWPDFNSNTAREYYQAHLPVRKQDKAVGHAVRALYMYSGIADLALETADESLLKTAYRLWENTTQKQMYITGGLGSTVHGEAFTIDYDLPNDTAYTETCAAVALIFFADRMHKIDQKSEYIDVLERALYNGALSGMSADGKRFFYVNPLEVKPEVDQARKDHQHVKITRQKWFGCACCPPNLARLLASIGSYIYSKKSASLYVNLYTANQAEFEMKGEKIKLVQQTNYPWTERISLEFANPKAVEFELNLRIPGWCKEFNLKIDNQTISDTQINEKGYLSLKKEWGQQKIELVLKMPVEKIYANPAVKEDINKVALQRGPIVYALEEIDNGKNLAAISLTDSPELKSKFDQDLLDGVAVIESNALKLDQIDWQGGLYSVQKPVKQPIKIKAIPYYAWNNRGIGEMTVWLNQN